MNLPTATLGTTAMDLTRVGFGAWAVGGGGWKFGWGQQDDQESISAMRHAVASGINWIDTAPVYGLGRSEEIVGRALQQMSESERPYVFTKCGLSFDRARPDEGPWNVMAAASVRRELESSLRRLGLERIDLYQVHWPPEDGTPLEDYWETMLELKRSGLVRAIGLSNHDEQQLTRAESLGHVDSLQPPFSMIHRDAGAGLLQRCAAQRTGAIVYSPMQSGLLTGAMSEARIQSLPEDDWRRTHEDFTGESGRRNLALADALQPIAERHAVAPGAVAIAWTLCWPGLTGAIVGARSPAQVDGWLPAASLALEDEDIAELATMIERTRAGSGPLAADSHDAS
jgi:aryl-alcohol dehydrogenase-like predicted oxidoreductase